MQTALDGGAGRPACRTRSATPTPLTSYPKTRRGLCRDGDVSLFAEGGKMAVAVRAVTGRSGTIRILTGPDGPASGEAAALSSRPAWDNI